MPRQGGPYPHVRVPLAVKVREGQAVLNLVAAGASVRRAARELGMSPSTARRRYWFVLDYSLPGAQGIPPQRSTRARPRG